MDITKNTFVSKNKLIENYENIIRRKDDSIRNLKKENQEFKEIFKTNNELIKDLISENKVIFNNKIDRLEKIKIRTKKIKTKKKCENRILKIEEKLLSKVSL